MGSIYVLLFTLLLYIFFGTIVDVFVATDSSAQLFRVKTKVFFNTFVAPLIFGFVILFVILTDNKAFSIFFGAGLIIGSIGRVFFRERKYLTSLILDNSHLEISYLTPLIKTKTSRLNLTGIANSEIEKANWLIDYPAAINVKSNGEWMKFYLIDKRLKSAIQNKVDEVKKSAQVGLATE